MIQIIYRGNLYFEFWVHGLSPSGISDTLAHGELTSGGYFVDVRLDELGSDDCEHCRRLGPFPDIDDAVLAAIVATANDPLFSK